MRSGGSQASDDSSYDSETNLFDIEAANEYDQQSKQSPTARESFEEDQKSIETPEPQPTKKKNKKLRRQTMRKKEDEKVLTFVDMSALSYLSKSVNQDNGFVKRKENKTVEIPMDLKTAIVEDVSEEDYNSEEEESKQALLESEKAEK